MAIMFDSVFLTPWSLLLL